MFGIHPQDWPQTAIASQRTGRRSRSLCWKINILILNQNTEPVFAATQICNVKPGNEIGRFQKNTKPRVNKKTQPEISQKPVNTDLEAKLNRRCDENADSQFCKKIRICDFRKIAIPGFDKKRKYEISKKWKCQIWKKSEIIGFTKIVILELNEKAKYEVVGKSTFSACAKQRNPSLGENRNFHSLTRTRFPRCWETPDSGSRWKCVDRLCRCLRLS